MAPIATAPSTNDTPLSLKTAAPTAPIKSQQQDFQSSLSVAYGSLASISTTASKASATSDEPSYAFNHLKPSFPEVDWPPIEPLEVIDRGLHAPSRSLGTKGKRENLVLKKAGKGKWSFITPALGVEIQGVDILKLTDEEKDDLALLAGQVGVVVVRDQHDLKVEEQREFGRYFGPLHKHATTAIPKRGDLDEVHLVYADEKNVINPTAFAREELYHSDVTYEIQPPALTSLYLVTQPEVGGDTIFSSGYALYSSFSPAFQIYLESLSAVHSAVAQANGSRAAGHHVRREPIETVHPVVRVHPVTGLKSIFVNPGFTRRIIGVPKAESDAILALLFRGFAASADFQVRARWQPGTLVFWDNRVVLHSALFDFSPFKRHGTRITPHGERPTSVADFERQTGRKALDWAKERARDLGIEDSSSQQTKADDGKSVERGFKD